MTRIRIYAPRYRSLIDKWNDESVRLNVSGFHQIISCYLVILGGSLGILGVIKNGASCPYILASLMTLYCSDTMWEISTITFPLSFYDR